MSPGYSLKRLKQFCSKNSAESGQKLTLREWVEKLRDPKSSDEWMTLGLPWSLTIEEKSYLIGRAPLPFYKGELEQLAAKMNCSSLSQLGQLVRYECFINGYVSDMTVRWCQDAVKADILGRWIVQREICIRQQAHALQKSLHLPSVSNTDTSSIPTCHEEQYKTLNGYEEELQNINHKYIKHHRNHWKLQANVPIGPVQAAFQVTRQTSTWTSLPWLKEDCAGRGGCCARNCGCCEKPRDTNRHFYNQGHCTTACACCINANAIDDPDSFDDIRDFPLDATSLWNGYTRRVVQAYIFGLDSIKLLLT